MCCVLCARYMEPDALNADCDRMTYAVGHATRDSRTGRDGVVVRQIGKTTHYTNVYNIQSGNALEKSNITTFTRPV